MGCKQCGFCKSSTDVDSIILEINKTKIGLLQLNKNFYEIYDFNEKLTVLLDFHKVD